jgi:Nucleoplasmin-like domain
MSFWSVSLKPQATYTLPEDAPAQLLHLSAACLHEPKDSTRGCLQIKTEESTTTIAVLQKDKTEMVNFDLFFNTIEPPTFFNNSKNEIHLSGYYEIEDEQDDFDDMDVTSDEEDEEIPQLQAIKGDKKPLKSIQEESEEDSEQQEDSEEDQDSDDQEGSDDEEGSAMGSEMSDLGSDFEDAESDEEEGSEEEEESEEESKPEVTTTNKRKAPESAKAQPQAKVQKTEDVAESYVSQVVAFLKQNGKTAIGQLGSKVKKPESLPKLKQFLLSRKEFKITGDNLELSSK